MILSAMSGLIVFVSVIFAMFCCAVSSFSFFQSQDAGIKTITMLDEQGGELQLFTETVDLTSLPESPFKSAMYKNIKSAFGSAFPL